MMQPQGSRLKAPGAGREPGAGRREPGGARPTRTPASPSPAAGERGQPEGGRGEGEQPHGGQREAEVKLGSFRHGNRVQPETLRLSGFFITRGNFFFFFFSIAVMQERF